MLYPIVTGASAIYIETDQIISMTLATLVILMADGTTHTAGSLAIFNDVIRFVNGNHA